MLRLTCIAASEYCPHVVLSTDILNPSHKYHTLIMYLIIYQFFSFCKRAGLQFLKLLASISYYTLFYGNYGLVSFRIYLKCLVPYTYLETIA